MIEMSCRYIVLPVLLLAWLNCGPVVNADDGQAARSQRPAARSFWLNYGASLEGLPDGARVRVWLPVPQSNDHQKIRTVSRDLPGKPTVSMEPRYGNKILYFESAATSSGSITFNTSYVVRRQEVLSRSGNTQRSRLADQQRDLFLAANRKVPLEGRPLELLAGLDFSSDPLAIARVLYERVDEHVRYDKSEPGYGNGDVLWVCDSQFGNCTDFHSLFISFARSKGLPSRFEIGFPLPAERGQGAITGYHCWASFYTDRQGWVPVDISEADKHPEMKEYYFGNLTENRVTFTTGRDIELIPRQQGPALNYFVYPHIEVDGVAWPREQIQLQLSYKDR
jgi:transglutaminase-like putative cysteine protease